MSPIHREMSRETYLAVFLPLMEESKRFLGTLNESTFLELARSATLSVAFLENFIPAVMNGATTRSNYERKQNMANILVEAPYHAHLEDHFILLAEDFFTFPEDEVDSTIAEAGELEAFDDEIIEISDDEDEVMLISDDDDEEDVEFMEAYNRYEPENGGEISSEEEAVPEENAYQRMRRMWYQPAPIELDEEQENYINQF